jgi:hypothetical protein
MGTIHEVLTSALVTIKPSTVPEALSAAVMRAPTNLVG